MSRVVVPNCDMTIRRFFVRSPDAPMHRADVTEHGCLTTTHSAAAAAVAGGACFGSGSAGGAGFGHIVTTASELDEEAVERAMAAIAKGA